MAGACVRLVSALCLALATWAGGPLHAGGAWPRGAGKGFVSLSYSTVGEFLGYAEALAKRYEGSLAPLPPLDLTEETALFAEYGLTERLTFGIDRTARLSADSASTIFFARANFGKPGWHSSYGAEIGLGMYRDWRGIDASVLRAGLSWGRGFETRWGNGWIDIDAKVSSVSTLDSLLWKVDSTIGLDRSERSLLYLQLQTGAFDGYPTYTRAVPTWVMRFGRGISVESALLVGLKNDDTQGFKVGTWLEF